MNDNDSNTIPQSERESELITRLGEARTRILDEMHKIIVGQDEVLEQMLLCLLCRGHCMLQGVPGLAKTTMVHTLSRCLDLSFGRIQFTPDLMPSDITGTDIIQEDPETNRRQFEFIHGPIFANLVLADEINRTPPKTQAALLEAMQERSVSVRAHTYELPDPFFVLATQNPIEQEGTYQLPEAQLDRFMFQVHITYPSKDEEIEILKRTTGQHHHVLKPLFNGNDIIELQNLVTTVPVADHVYAYAVDLVQATRPGIGKVKDVSEWLQWGAGPRAGQMLILGAKARALLHNRFHVICDDIDALANPVLRHRLVPTFAAQAQGIDSDTLIDRLVAHAAHNSHNSHTHS